MKGFTLLELMVIMTITLIVGTASFLSFPAFRSRNTLRLSGDELRGQLRDAQFRAISQDSSSKWGVHFEGVPNGNDWYAVFSGDTYAGGAVQTKSSLPSNLKFIDPAEGASKDVIFEKLTGVTAATAANISLIDNTQVFYAININANGLISYAKSF